MTFQEKFHQSLKEWLAREGVDVDTVIGYDDDAYLHGCGTCGGNAEIEVDIKYIDNEGATRVFTFGGSFSDILKELV